MDIMQLASVICSAASCIVAITAFIISTFYAANDSKHYFENTVESNLSSLATFIKDSFLIVSDEKIYSCEDLDAAEGKLIDGFHHLFLFASVNGFKCLKEFSIIRTGNWENDSKSFAYNFLLLEDFYIKYRRKLINCEYTEEIKEIIESATLFFSDYLDLVSKNMLRLRRKKRGMPKCYYDELNRLRTQVEEFIREHKIED